jgi:hypothetical protein
MFQARNKMLLWNPQRDSLNKICKQRRLGTYWYQKGLRRWRTPQWKQLLTVTMKSGCWIKETFKDFKECNWVWCDINWVLQTLITNRWSHKIKYTFKVSVKNVKYRKDWLRDTRKKDEKNIKTGTAIETAGAKRLWIPAWTKERELWVLVVGSMALSCIVHEDDRSAFWRHMLSQQLQCPSSWLAFYNVRVLLLLFAVPLFLSTSSGP